MARTSLRLTAAVAAFAASAAPAAAQTWQAIGTPANNTPGMAAYWNNRSTDNENDRTVCNIGAVLTNTGPLTAASCSNEAPPTLLPLSPAPLTTSNVFLGGTGGAQPGAFRFAPGAYNFTLLGRISGVPTTNWGIRLADGTMIGSSTLTGATQSITQSFSFFLQQALPEATPRPVLRSDLLNPNQHFTVFTNAFGVGNAGLTTGLDFGTLISPTAVQSFWIGMEDNSNFRTVRPLSDEDFNDIIVRVQAVPEPSTYALMASGLALMGVVARRRRTA